MKLAIDAMSGDQGSSVVVDALIEHLKSDHSNEFVVVGKIEELSRLETYNNVELLDARDILSMEESVMAIRRKKEASLVKTITLAREDKVDAVLSCGNTGVFYGCAMLFLKRIPGVEKSCLMASLPTYTGSGALMLDCGANAANTAAQLRSFAIMADVYAKSVLKIAQPRIGLLNIGTESKKGDEMHQEAYGLLEETADLNFVGNVEGTEILSGDYDIVVTDGFTGNVALKTIEGVAKLLMKGLRDALMSSTRTKLGAALAKPGLYQLRNKFGSDAAGGALMMGFKKPVIKAHGSSNSTAIKNAIELAIAMANENVVEKLEEGLAKWN